MQVSTKNLNCCFNIIFSHKTSSEQRGKILCISFFYPFIKLLHISQQKLNQGHFAHWKKLLTITTLRSRTLRGSCYGSLERLFSHFLWIFWYTKEISLENVMDTGVYSAYLTIFSIVNKYISSNCTKDMGENNLYHWIEKYMTYGPNNMNG